MYPYVSNNNETPTDIISKTKTSMLTSTPPSAPIPIKQRHRSSFSQTRKRRPSESTSRLVHSEDRDRLASSKLQATTSSALSTTATFTTTPSGALALSLSPPGLGSGLSKSAPLENESIPGQAHRKKGTTFKCETCSKVYRHPSCLVKHRWEHSPHWHEASKFLLSKHQQVQLLEAAAILSHLSPATAGGTSLPDDRSLWPSFLSGGVLPIPPGHPTSVPTISNVILNTRLSPTEGSFPASANIPVPSGTADSVMGVKIEASAEENVPVESEDSTSDEEDGVDIDVEDVELEEDLNIVDGDTDRDDVHNNAPNSKSSDALVSSTSATPNALDTNARIRTATPALSFASSKSSTPKPLPTQGTIPARAGLTEIRPGLLGHPNPPISSTLGPSFGNGQTQIGVLTTPWNYPYPHSSFNEYAAVSQASSADAISTVQTSPSGPYSMSAPLSVPSFPHIHNAAYSPSPGNYTISHSYSPIGSISGPFSALSLSSLPYSSSVLEDESQPKGLCLPRSSVRSSSMGDEDTMIEDDDLDASISETAKKCRHTDDEHSVVPAGESGEWEMEI